MTVSNIIDQGNGIYTIDSGYQRAGLVAVHLMRQGDRVALVDVGTSSCLPVLQQALVSLGINNEQVDYILVTHVHLDHAGAAGVLMQSMPNAKLLVHPRGARHMIDPTRLIAGATAVYGEAVFQQTFGDVLPVDADRVIEVADGFELNFNGRSLLFADTPGHARHHYCVFDAQSKGWFTGDTFGLSYAPLAVDSMPYIFPTTTPVQFDPDALHASIERLLDADPQRMFLTHFACVESPRILADRLHKQIDAMVAMVQACPDSADQACHNYIYQSLRSYLLDDLHDFGCKLSEDEVIDLMEMDLQLNTQGLCYWLQQQTKGS